MILEITFAATEHGWFVDWAVFRRAPENNASFVILYSVSSDFLYILPQIDGKVIIFLSLYKINHKQIIFLYCFTDLLWRTSCSLSTSTTSWCLIRQSIFFSKCGITNVIQTNINLDFWNMFMQSQGHRTSQSKNFDIPKPISTCQTFNKWF